MDTPETTQTESPTTGPGRAWIIGYITALGLLAAALVVTALLLPQPGNKANAPSAKASAGASTVPTMVTVRIATGDTGATVAKKLATAHVVSSADVFYQNLLTTLPEPVFYPGTYTLPTRLTPDAALTALANPDNRKQVKIVIPEGYTAAQVYTRAAQVTGLPVADFKQAGANIKDLGVPGNALNVEGWLFPATYTFEPDVSAKAILRAMVERTGQALDDAGLTDASTKKRQEVLTLASVVQKESGAAADSPKVARVFLNRLAKKMPLQSDATVSYGAGGTTVSPTAKEYADKNGYNTYKVRGLPVGPISNPGDIAIEAAVNPASGPWLYFVTVNLKTGETAFSTTYAQHEKAVAKFRTWQAANPDYR